MVDNKLLPKLTQNLLEILNDEEFYDITIEVGKDPYVKIFRAHMIILYYRSSYLQRILSTNNIKKNDGTLMHIKLPNILPEIFQIILRYLYCGSLTLKEYDTLDIIKILVAANELNLQELITYLQSFLIENKKQWMEKNLDLIYQMSFENNSFFELQKYCTNLITKEPDKLFNSTNFTLIPENLLISVIQNSRLQISNIQIWEHVLKWGLAQHPELPSDVENYSKDDFNTLKNTLQQCIPFIDFYNLTSKEFMDKVLPYKRILAKEMYKDLLKFYLSLSDPNNKSTIDSKIITYQHIELISKWINRLEIMDKLNSPYKFQLLFRGSRDGLSGEKFHEICDNQYRTVTVIKVRDSSEILGGYNPVEWRSDGSYGTTKDSFIFSFDNDDRIENYILSRVMNECYATFNGIFNGPSFGYNDLTILGTSLDFGSYCRSKKKFYEKSIRKTENEFTVEECEVFQIIFQIV